MISLNFYLISYFDKLYLISLIILQDAHNISDALDQLSLAGKLSHVKRQQNWEMGNIDYMGIDAFENIQKKVRKIFKYYI